MIAARAETRRRAGFTLIEIMAGVAIFLICVVSIMSLFGVAIDAHKGQVDRSTAAIVAQSAFSHFRAFPPSDVHPSPTPEPWVLDLAGNIREDDTTIDVARLPDLAQSLARLLAAGLWEAGTRPDRRPGRTGTERVDHLRGLSGFAGEPPERLSRAVQDDG